MRTTAVFDKLAHCQHLHCRCVGATRCFSSWSQTKRGANSRCVHNDYLAEGITHSVAA